MLDHGEEADAATSGVPMDEEQERGGDQEHAGGGEDEADLEQVAAEAVQCWAGKYSERQDSAKCGQHALNNIIGGPVFGDDELSEACTQVLQASQDPEAMHRRAFGWYSHSVLGQCLQNTLPPMYRLLLTPCTQSDWEDLATNPAYHGALVNCANRHWTAVVKHNDLLFYVDSMKEPILHMEADFLSLLGSHPMVFCVVSADYEVPIDAANLAADYKL